MAGPGLLKMQGSPTFNVILSGLFLIQWLLVCCELLAVFQSSELVLSI